MNNSTYVDKSEVLYRRILSNKCKKKTPSQYTVEPSGNIRILSPAFLGGDRISVYRAELIGFKPECVDKKSTDGVISIKAVDIKAIRIREYAGDVEITPLPNNAAHADIVLLPTPDKMTRSLLSNLRDALARKATCIVEPNPL